MKGKFVAVCVARGRRGKWTKLVFVFAETWWRMLLMARHVIGLIVASGGLILNFNCLKSWLRLRLCVVSFYANLQSIWFECVLARGERSKKPQMQLKFHVKFHVMCWCNFGAVEILQSHERHKSSERDLLFHLTHCYSPFGPRRYW